MSIRNESIFPRDPNGNRDNSIVKANEQLTQAFSDSPSSNGPAKGNSFILKILLKLITQLIMLLENRETPSKPDPKKEAPVKPEQPIDKKNPDPGKMARPVYGIPLPIDFKKPDPEDIVRPVYGAPISDDFKKPEPEKPKPWKDEGARGVYGGAIGRVGPDPEKEIPSKSSPIMEKEKR